MGDVTLMVDLDRSLRNCEKKVSLKIASANIDVCEKHSSIISFSGILKVKTSFNVM